MSEQFLYFDDTNSALEYSANQWFDNSGIEGTFNHTLSSTTSQGATVKIEFIATQIAVIGATIAFPGASSSSGPLSSYSLDGSQNSAFVYAANATNATSVPFFVSSTLSEGKHSLEIEVLTVSEKAPFLLDAIALLKPEETSTSAAVWVTTVFVVSPTSSSQPSSNVASSGSSLPVGAIVGGVIGGAALLLGAFFAFYFLFYRPRHSRYNYRGVSAAGPFDEYEKDHLTARPVSGTPMEPFFVPAAAAATSYSDTTPSRTPYASEYSSSVPSAPHTYPPPGSVSGSAAGSALTSGSSESRRTLSVVNSDKGGAALALTPSQRKTAEARPLSETPSVQYHADSGVRFDDEGKPIEPVASGSGSHEPALVDVPPEYSEL